MALLLPMVCRMLRPLAKTWKPLRSVGLLPSLSERCFSHGRRQQSGDVLLMDEVSDINCAVLTSPDEIKRLRSSDIDVTSLGSLSARGPDHSHSRAVIPLGSDVKAREKYVTARGDIRLGQILEDFDNFSGFCCLKHNRDDDMQITSQKSTLLLVTVLFDQIDIDISKPPLSPHKDIFLEGNVTWAGKTSMECTLYLEQELDGKLEQFMKATVVFVSRHPITLQPALIAPLDVVTDEDKKAFQQGIKNKEKRLREAAKSVLKTAPSVEESLMIHDIFLSSLDAESGTLHGRVKPQDSIWMEDTILKSCIVCHPSERNVFNKIFGGFLMNKAFEIAYTTATVHSKCSHPRCKNIDDMLFQQSVEIGSLLFFSSQIVYNKGSDLQIRVRAKQLRTGESEVLDMTNDCHFTFDCSDTGKEDFVMPQVLPKTYAEAMLYVDGKRRYDQVG